MAFVASSAHNNFRSHVTPPASDMREMKWDEELAELALIQAQRCNVRHTRVSHLKKK